MFSKKTAFICDWRQSNVMRNKNGGCTGCRPLALMHPYRDAQPSRDVACTWLRDDGEEHHNSTSVVTGRVASIRQIHVTAYMLQLYWPYMRLRLSTPMPAAFR
eukprot:8728111-Pyramimonas_sp.AAC.3